MSNFVIPFNGNNFQQNCTLLSPMTKKKLTKYLVSILIISFLITSAAIPEKSNNWDEDTPVIMVLAGLGEPYPDHYQLTIDRRDSLRGADIFNRGYTINPWGKVSDNQSKFFKCNDCHNTVKEDPDLKHMNPESRLEFAVREKIPFLPGTTMYGVVNRTSWYNGDYVKKYGKWVEAANKSLEEAIQLCARECSQGRELDEWELKAMLVYFQSLEYKMGDLNLSSTDWEKLNAANGKEYRTELIPWLKSFYTQASPATFEPVPDDFDTGYGIAGDADNGKNIYESSCKSCHQPFPYGVSDFLLDDSRVTFKKLKKNLTKNTGFNIYNAIRLGTEATEAHRSYMPLFTAERMSNKQIEDLRAYILKQAN